MNDKRARLTEWHLIAINIIILIICITLISSVLSASRLASGDSSAAGTESTGETDQSDDSVTAEYQPSETSGENSTEKTGEGESTADSTEGMETATEETTEESTEAPTDPEPWKAINSDGMTLLTRFNTPEGYSRKETTSGTFAEFVVNYPLKEDGAPVLLYNGTPWESQDTKVAVFALPIENLNRQQCADSVMRFYAEYYWSQGCAEQIKLHYSDQFISDYAKWRDGYRIQYDSKHNQFSWYASYGYDASYKTFVSYLHHMFAYAGSLSLDVYDSVPVTLEELEIGDLLLEGGSPGHVIMVVDMCYDEAGRKAFLLADGHIPAMDFHVMKNPRHEEDPWYYEEEIQYPFRTYAHIYSEGCLRRLTLPKDLTDMSSGSGTHAGSGV